MPKININSIKFKIYFLFIISNLVVFSIGIFLTVHYIALYSRKSLREELRSGLMTGQMEFIGDRNYMLEKANDIVAHNFKSRFIRKISDSKKISSIVLIKIKNGQADYINKFKYKYNNKVKKLSNYQRFMGIILTRKQAIFTGFGRDKSDRLISLRVIYWLIHKNNGFIIILNKHITSDYLRSIVLKNHMAVNLGVYYGAKRSAVSTVKNHRYWGLGQSATEKQLLVLKKGKSVYTFVIVNGVMFYIYNKPIKNYGGRIIGILGSGIEQYRWFWYLSKIYIPILFFIGLSIFTILIFYLVNKKFSDPFYDLLKSIEKIDPNNPERQDLAGKYQNKESEFYEFAKAITALNDTIIEKQEENNLIVSNINYFSKTVSDRDDFNSLTIKLMNLIVERMGYSYAWFGVLDEDRKEVKIINAYNNDFSYTNNLMLKYDDQAGGLKYSQNLAARAIKSKNYAVINDALSDTTIPLYKDKLLEYKFLSLGVFPLIAQGNIIGVLGIYSGKKDAFDSIKAGAIFNLANYVSYLMTYLKNLKRSQVLSEMAEQILSPLVTGHGHGLIKFYNKEFLNNLENNLQTDFIEFIVYDKTKNEITESVFSRGWDYNIGISSIAPAPTLFVQKRIVENRLDTYNYQEDEFATEGFKNMGVKDIILYAFEGTGGRRYLAVTGVINRRTAFYGEDLEFFRDGINLFATYFEINTLFEKLDSSLGLLENRENLINKMVEFGVVSINLTDKVVSLYNDYFAQVFNLDKFSAPISLDKFYENIKPAFEGENFAYNIFEKYIKNRYVTTIESIEINLKSGIILSMKSSIFLTKSGGIIRLLVFGNITEPRNYTKNLEDLTKKLNLLNDLSYKLSTVFTLEYALKIFAEGLYAVKNTKGSGSTSLHINIFDTISKKTVTSLICTKKEEEIEKGRGNGFIDENRRVKMMVATNKIDYDDYLSSCKLLKNGGGKDKTVNDCEFRGTDGGYTCFSLKISNEVVGTVSVESKDKDFFTEEITGLIKEIINIASPVFAKLILIETNKDLAITDPLTGIYNRRYMYEFAKREIIRANRNSTNLSMAILDIDRFKNINDNYGHQIGDSMLAEFAVDLRNILMRGQDIITRYGGDEFVIILPDTDRQNAVNLMEKLRNYFKSKTYSFENNVSISITVSSGVSSVKHPLKPKIIDNNGAVEDILNDLLKVADENLYRAKDLGRDRVVG
ncbi:MAG: diguanylate cyclase [Candidatus Acidulodesulfobacterium ferriphilum]|uniref:Diguanylate cyclase n=1 Tax=Candidatus Acidulodesulfobacterium ferriphilum TaxID=2597223 RepID=A0A519BDE3_9DELT|nr:MAG: diguanylate cyclase [Candidatus Acidulodesulfobacterium ferriphilum]